MSKIIAIDLGSTLSEVSVMEGGNPTIIINDEGARTTPSVVFFDDNSPVVGSAAKRKQVLSPDKTILLIKRLMGCTYEEAKNDICHMQYKVVDDNGYPRVLIGDKKYSPEEISAMIISKLKRDAESYLGEEVKDAVITVPAYFNDAQRQATKRAGEIAGLNVQRIIAEPTAALLAAKLNDKDGKYMVVDYGGATLDFSVADIMAGDDSVIEILASSGDVYCGGSDIDNIVSKWIITEFNKEHPGSDVSKDSMALARIGEAAEKAKIELSNANMTEINLPYLTAIDNMPVHFIKTLTKATFESLIEPEINRVLSKGKDALSKAGLKSSELNGILLVGGTTRIPYIQKRLSETFGAELIKSVNPDEAVSLGAAIQGGVLSGDVKDIVLLDVTPLNLGIETMGGMMSTIVTANSTIPIQKSEVFTTAADNQPGVNIVVVQGNRPMVSDNKIIGTFTLDGIAPAPRGVPQIEVSFNIDVNGIVTVNAKDKATGKEQHITISNNGGISKEDIERMKAEAEQYKDADNKRLQEAQELNMAESTALNIKKTIDTDAIKDKVSEENKTKLIELCDKILDATSKKEIDTVKETFKELSELWSPIAQELYKDTTSESPEPEVQNPFDVKK